MGTPKRRAKDTTKGHVYINAEVVPYVLDNMPPLFPHYFVSNVGRGLILEYTVSLDYTPPQPFLLHTVPVQTPQKVMFT